MTRTEILNEAIRITTLDRNSTHGDPEDNFKIIAAYWQTYLTSIGVFKSFADKGGVRNLQPADVATMMILMKASRLATSPEHADHWVDIAGYAACGGGVVTKDKPKDGNPIFKKHKFVQNGDRVDSPICQFCGNDIGNIIHT